MDLAIELFWDLFHHQIWDINQKYPEDAKTEEGKLFWSGLKRKPEPLSPGNGDEYVIGFITSTARIYCHTFKLNLPDQQNITDIIKLRLLSENTIPLSVDEKFSEKVYSENLKEMISQLAKKTIKKRDLFQISFDDRHFHDLILSFIYDAANLRCVNFGLETVKKYKVEHWAFNIAPNMTNINTISAGLSMIDLVKYFVVSYRLTF